MRGMNKLPLAKRVQILSMLCEGSSMRSISRMADVSINTVAKLLVDAGKACAAFHDEKVRGVKGEPGPGATKSGRFTYAKQKNVPKRQGRARRRWRHVDVDRARRRHQADRLVARRRP